MKSHRIDSQSKFISETLEIPSRKIPLNTPLQHEIEREIKERVLNIYSDMETDPMSHDDVGHKLNYLGEYCDSLD